MNWLTILKRPQLPIPDYDINWEYDPQLLTKIVEDWDRQNPATVLHIEVSTPDPAETMFDADRPERQPIRFSRSGSQKFVSERVRFITDRPIDEQSGLFEKLRSEGYKVWDKNADWIRANYQNKLGNIIIPDTAKYYAIGVKPEKARKEREKEENKEKIQRFPDRSRKEEDIKAWHKTKKEFELDKVEGFVKFITEVLDKESLFQKPYESRHLAKFPENIADMMKKENVVKLAKEQLKGGFGRNKHELYLRQQLPISNRWVNQNIFIPVQRMEIKRLTDDVLWEKERRKELNWDSANESRKLQINRQINHEKKARSRRMNINKAWFDIIKWD